MADGGDTGKVGEGCLIGGHDRPVGGPGGGGDQQVVSAARASLAANGNEELGVLDRNTLVVGDDGERLEDPFDVGLADIPSLARSKADPYEQLGDGDGRDGYVVVITDCFVEVDAATFAIDQECGVEEKKTHVRSSVSTSSRSSVRSFDHAASGR